MGERSSIHCGSVALACALVALLCLPVAASAEGWTFKFASPEKVEATETQVGVDGNGNVTTVWRNDTDIKDSLGTLSISSALLPFGAEKYNGPLPINSSGGGSPVIGVLANGNAVVAWERNSGGVPSKDIIEGATRTLGTWTGVTELTDSGDETADYLTMDMLPNGEGLLAWRVGGTEKDKVRLIQGGNFQGGVAKTFNTSPYSSNNEADVAIAPDASRRFLAGHKNDLGNTRLNLFTYEGTTWDSGTFIANPTLVPQVAAAPNGEAVTAWLESNVLKLKRGGSDIVTVANVGNLSRLDLAVGPKTEEFPTGMVLVTWRQFVQDPEELAGACCYQARAAVGSGVTMGAPIELSDELESVTNFPAVQAAIAPDGTAYTAWTRFDGGFWIPEASIRPPGESFPAVADQISGGDAYVRDLVVGADGRAIVGIDHIDSEGDELYFRAGTAIYEPGLPQPKEEPGPPPPGPGPPAPPPADNTPPKVKVGLSRNVFAPGGKLNQVAVRDGDPSYVWKAVRTPLKVGTRLLISLDEPANLTIKVNKLGCLKAKPGNPMRNISGQCVRPDDDVQKLRTKGKAGANKLTYLGDWNGGKVKPGALYQFVVVATDKFGNASKPRAVGFSLDGKQNANGF